MPFVAPTLLTIQQSPSAVVRFGGGSKLGTGSSGPFAICDSAEILSNNGLIDYVNPGGPYFSVEIDQQYILTPTDIRVTIKSPFTGHTVNGPGTFDVRIAFLRDVESPFLYTINPDEFGPYLIDDSVIQSTGSEIITAVADPRTRTREGFAIVAETTTANTTGSWFDTVDIMFEVV